jgi:HNH endonuclease
VAARAGHRCEYCLIHADDTFFGCEVDHIISEKHGGATREDNLAYACLFCNRNKGSDIASILPETGELVRLFNPRLDRWGDHLRRPGWNHDPSPDAHR